VEKGLKMTHPQRLKITMSKIALAVTPCDISCNSCGDACPEIKKDVIRQSTYKKNSTVHARKLRSMNVTCQSLFVMLLRV
jgi:hypothetical protein